MQIRMFLESTRGSNEPKKLESRSCFAPSSRLRSPWCCHGTGSVREEKDSMEQAETRDTTESSFFEGNDPREGDRA